MTKVQNYLLLLLLCYAFTNITAQQNIRTERHPIHKNINLKSYVSELDVSKYNIIYQQLNFKINPAILYIEGAVTFHYQAETSLDTLVLNLSDSLTVDSVKRSNTHLIFQHQNNSIRININDIPEGNIDSLTVFYRGRPDETHNAFFIDVQDEVSQIPVLATLSEPYGASDWFPCKNTLTDKIDSLDINITAPIGNIGVSHGLLQGVDTNGTEVTYRWKHRYPIAPYLVSIAVSDYLEHHRYLHLPSGDSVRFENYLYHQNYNFNVNEIAKTDYFFPIFDSLFSPYPFANEKYGHVQFPMGGGMEHQTISSMGRFDFGIISHELAHQWFGDYITCGSWLDLWLNEGFATYSTGLCFEAIHPDSYWSSWKEYSVGTIVSENTGTVIPNDTLDFNDLFSFRLTYRKASYLLHMIRWTIGDEAFFEAIKNYLSDENLAFSFAKTPQLIAHFEQVADTSLSTFMDDWFYGEGYPIFDIEWSQDENQNLYIEMSQSDASLNDRFFELYVPLRLVGENDSLDIRIHHHSNNQMFIKNINFEVTDVKFDPDLWLISKNTSVVNGVEEEGKHRPKLYPNPTNGLLYLPLNSNINSVSILDSKGVRQNIRIKDNLIDISELPRGFYTVQFSVNGRLTHQKIIKQ